MQTKLLHIASTIWNTTSLFQMKKEKRKSWANTYPIGWQTIVNTFPFYNFSQISKITKRENVKIEVYI